MQLLGTISLGNAGASSSLELKAINPGKRVARLIMRVRGLVTVGGGGGTPAVADLVSALNHFLGSVRLKHGPGRKLLAYDGTPGGEMRAISRALSWREIVNDFVGVAGQGTAAPHTWVMDVPIHFAPTWQKGTKRYPGSSQVAGMELEIREDSGAFAGAALTLTRTAGVVLVDVLAEYARGSDQIAPILSYRTADQSLKKVVTEDGLPVLLFDANAAQASTLITQHKVAVGEEVMVADVSPTEMGRRWTRQLDAGGSDVLDTWTLLYAPDAEEDAEEWPSGPVQVELVSQTVASQKHRFLFYPSPDEVTLRAQGKQVAELAQADAVLLTTQEPTRPLAAPGAAAFLPVEIRKPGSNRYESLPGVLVTRAGGSQVVIPQHTRGEIAGIVAGGKPGSQPALAGIAAQMVARRIPGAIRSDGARVGAGGSAVSGVVMETAGVAPTSTRN